MSLHRSRAPRGAVRADLCLMIVLILVLAGATPVAVAQPQPSSAARDALPPSGSPTLICDIQGVSHVSPLARSRTNAGRPRVDIVHRNAEHLYGVRPNDHDPVLTVLTIRDRGEAD